MLIENLSDKARALLLICAAAAAMETLTRDERGALAFRSLCALATAVGAARLMMELLGSG